jgi:hypothetical protein
MAGLNKLQLQVFGSQRKKSILPDFTGYGLTRLFALFKPIQATINYPIKIHDAVGNRDLYVFFDTNNEISLDSPLSVTTTPTSEVLGDLVVGTVNIEVISIFCIISGIECTGDGGFIVINGELVTDEGKAAIFKSDSTKGYSHTALSDFNSNAATFYKAKNSGGNSPSSIIHTSTNIYGWRHTISTYANREIARYRKANFTAGGVNITVINRLLKDVSYYSLVTVDKTAETFKLYLDGVYQSTRSLSAMSPVQCNNNTFLLLKGLNTDGFIGYFNCCAVINRTATEAENLEIKSLLDKYFI